MPSASYARVVRDDTFAQEGHFVYTIHDRDGEPIYVGLTVNPRRRLEEHRRGEWGHEAHRMSYVRFDDHREALTAEATAIAARDPKHNRARPDPSTSGLAAVTEDPCACPDWCCHPCSDLSAKGRKVSERCKTRMRRAR